MSRCVHGFDLMRDRTSEESFEWHIITGEYPPQNGGVSDYSGLVAAGLSAAGDTVHVWCPGEYPNTAAQLGVQVHRKLGRLSLADLRRVGKLLDEFAKPRHVLVQWVPHAFGYRAMNVGFCLWLLGRSRIAGDDVSLMVHEAHVAFGSSVKENVIAIANRVMNVLLLQAATRIWVATPAWTKALRPYGFGRTVPFEWLPVPSNVARTKNPEASAKLRERYAPEGKKLIGHFGTYGRPIAPLLDELIPILMHQSAGSRLLLLGRGSDRYRRDLLKLHPGLSERVFAPAILDDTELSLHIAACDFFVQPYPEGLSARRGSAMAVVGHGKAMVSSSGRYTEAIWRDYGAALLAPLHEGPRGLVDRAIGLLENPGELLSLAAAAERLYRDRFDIGHTLEAFRSWQPQAGSHPGVMKAAAT